MFEQPNLLWISGAQVYHVTMALPLFHKRKQEESLEDVLFTVSGCLFSVSLIAPWYCFCRLLMR